MIVRIVSPKVVKLLLSVFCLLPAGQAFAGQTLTPSDTIKNVEGVVAELQSRLKMAQHIEVSIVPVETRMLSVQRIPDDSGRQGFLISVDQGFVDSLTDDELRAAIAHELGHVWIFSHHPYLQTEALANEVAMRVVSRDHLKTLYAKLWRHLGTSGDLDQILGSHAAGPSAAIPATAPLYR